MTLIRQPTVLVELMLIDREGSARQTSFRLPAALSYSQLLASTDAVVNAIKGISIALVESVTFNWSFVEDELLPAPEAAVRGPDLQLFYTNASDMFPFFVPCPDPALFIQTGRYAGIKVNMRDPVVLARLEALTIALEATVNHLGEDRDPVLVTGGR